MKEFTLGNALASSVLGMFIVFLMLVMLMGVIVLLGKLLKKNKPAPVAAPVPAAAPAPTPAQPKSTVPAPGTAGSMNIHSTPPRTAAMLMAIVADELKVPVNELRFIDIKEIKG